MTPLSQKAIELVFGVVVLAIERSLPESERSRILDDIAGEIRYQLVVGAAH